MRTLMSFVRKFSIVVAILIAILFSRFTFATDRYVDWNASGSNNTGEAEHPWTSLQTALGPFGAQGGDTIFIAQGTYKPTTGTTRSISFEISDKNLILQGGWINNGGGDWDFSPSTATTILSGDVGTGNADSFTVLKLSYSLASNSGTRIEHLTITGGYADGGSGQDSGAGVRITAGSPRLHNVKIAENHSKSHGAGAYISSASPVFTLCTIEDNAMLEPDFTSGNGGGLFATGTGTLNLINTTIRRNTVHGDGGGLAAEIGSLTLKMTNCLVADNDAIKNDNLAGTGRGGGVFLQGSNGSGEQTADLINVTIANNSGRHGGGLARYQCASGSDVRLRNTILWLNVTAPTVDGHQIHTTTAGIEADYCNVQGRTDADHVDGSVDWILDAESMQTNMGDDPDIGGADDPEFEDESNGDYRLSCGSISINKANPNSTTGSPPIIPLNTFDLGGLGTGVPTPDLDLLTRLWAGRVDQGAYERPIPSCPKDIAPPPGDGIVGVPDLLAVINAWGACPGTCPPSCLADFSGDCQVGVPDLLAIINNWGTCPCRIGSAGSIPAEITDCMEICANEENYGECVTKCLCAIGYYTQECD